MKIFIFLFLSILSYADTTYLENASIGTPPSLDAKAILQLNSTDKGSLFCPSMTTAQKTAIAAPIPEGMCVLDSNLNSYQIYSNSRTAWVPLGSSGFITYTPGNGYKIGDYIINAPNNQLFRARNNFTATNIISDIANNLSFVSPSDITSSVFSGGTITFNTPNFDVTDGTGVLTKNNGTQFPSYYPMQWPARTGLNLPSPNDWNTVVVYPDAALVPNAPNLGTINIISGLPTSGLYYQGVVLGTIFGPRNRVENLKGATLDAGGNLRDLGFFLGILKNGFNLAGNANQTARTAAGSIYYNGLSPSTETVNVKDCAVQGTTNFDLYKQDAFLGTETTIPNNQWDNAGILTTMTAGYWSCFKIFLDISCKISFQYCQGEWPTEAMAKSEVAANQGAYVTNSELVISTRFVSQVFFKEATVDFSNDTDTTWENSGVLGYGSAGGAVGGSVGDVLGPASSVNNNLVAFDGVSGKVIKDSGKSINFFLTSPVQWAANTFYVVGQKITNGALIFEVKADYTSGATLADDYKGNKLTFVSNLDMSTAQISGGDLTINGTTNIDVASGYGAYVEDFINPFAPTDTPVVWNAGTIAACGIGTSSFSSIYVTPAGVISCAVGYPNQQLYSRNIVLGIAIHVGATIDSVTMKPWLGTNTNQQFRNLLLFLGYLKKGFEVQGKANLSLDMKSGQAYSAGTGYPSTEFPNTFTAVANPGFSFTPTLSTSITAPTTFLNVTSYQPNGVGALVNLTNNQYTWVPVIIEKNNIYIQYGQKQFGTMAEAEADLSNNYSDYILNPSLSNFCWSSTIIFQKNIIATTSAKIINYKGCLGGTTGASANSGTGGDVFGPISSLDKAIPRYSGSTGKLIQDSGVVIDDTNNVTGVNAITMASTLTVDTNTFFVDPTNNEVGIGRAAADLYAKLDVVGDIFTTIHGNASMHNAAEIGTTSIGMKSGNTTDGFTGMKLNVKATDSAGTAVANNSDIQFWTWGNGISVSREVARFTERGRLGVNTTNPLDYISVLNGINAPAGLLVANNGAGANSGSMLSLITFFPNTTSIVNATNRSWQIIGRGNAHATVPNSLQFINNNGNTANPIVTIAGAGKTFIGVQDNAVFNNVGSAALNIIGPGGQLANGPHMTFNDNGDIYPQRQFLNWGHDSVWDCFDCYHDGAAWRNSNASSAFRWAKSASDLTLAAVAAPTQGGAEALTTIANFNENGTLTLNRPSYASGIVNYTNGGAYLAMNTSRGSSGAWQSSSSPGGNNDNTQTFYNMNGGWGWKLYQSVQTNSPPSVRFEGNITAASYANNSSRILKKNISPIENSVVELFNKIVPVKYQWKDKPYLKRKIGEKLTDAEKETRWHFGIIADDTAKIFPDLFEDSDKTVIDYGEDGVAKEKTVKVKSFSPTDLLALTIKVVQEQGKKIKELEKRIKALESK